LIYKSKVFACLFLPEAFLSCVGKKGSKEADLVEALTVKSIELLV